MLGLTLSGRAISLTSLVSSKPNSSELKAENCIEALPVYKRTLELTVYVYAECLITSAEVSLLKPDHDAGWDSKEAA